MVKNAISVFARLKPQRKEHDSIDHKIYRRPEKNRDEDFLVLSAPLKPIEYIDNRPESWNFSFHKVFEDTAGQKDIFNDVARPVVSSLFEGYNGTVFAYGQTGSGKTYSITGDPENPEKCGILPRTLYYLFDTIEKNPKDAFSVELAYLEIYNESGYDLLPESFQDSVAYRVEDLPRVEIQEDECGKIYVKHLTFHKVTSVKEALDLLLIGDENRTTSETPMNSRSSRSHCIFMIILSVKKFGSDRCTRAKMNLVDLAGSERVYKCAINGSLLTEAKYINLSLHYLEQVIVCLGQDSTSHIPYRNSLLTAILRDSLGGNCITIMLATLSASTYNLEETISTCRFAQRVALIKNDVKLLFKVDVKTEIELLRMENEKLKNELNELKMQPFLEVDPPKGIEYYKELVIQRDKEIALLLMMINKQKTNINTKKEDKIVQTEKPKLSIKTQNSDVYNSPRNTTGFEDQMLLNLHKPTSPMESVEKIEQGNENYEIPEFSTASSPKNNLKTRKTLRQQLVPEGELFHQSLEPENIINLTTAAENATQINETTVKRVPAAEFIKNFQNNVINDPSNESLPNDENRLFRDSTFSKDSCEFNVQNSEKVMKESQSILEIQNEKKKEEDRIFNQSLPLTGDAEIDEEIIAFYRAKRSGGTY